jgi:FkbM family methyltransferase
VRRRWFPSRDEVDNARLELLAAFLLDRNANCLDVGCFDGRFLETVLRVAPGGKHIAYEPIPGKCAILRARFPSVEVRQAALAAEDGEATFQHVTTLPSHSGLRRRDYPHAVEIAEIRVRTERFDDHRPRNWVPTLIKIDVEGAECSVIEGALRTISEYRPVVAFEHGRGSAEHYGRGPADIHRLLVGAAGLRIFDLDGNGPYGEAEFEREFHAWGRWNWVAHR